MEDVMDKYYTLFEEATSFSLADVSSSLNNQILAMLFSFLPIAELKQIAGAKNKKLKNCDDVALGFREEGVPEEIIEYCAGLIHDITDTAEIESPEELLNLIKNNLRKKFIQSITGSDHGEAINKLAPKTILFMHDYLTSLTGDEYWYYFEDEDEDDGFDIDTDDYFNQTRPYQIDAIEKTLNAIENYEKNDGILFIKIPTGGGKTYVASQIVKDFLNQSSKNRVIWLAPNWLLIQQAYLSLRQVVNKNFLRCCIGNNEKRKSYPDLVELGDDLSGRIFLSSLHTWDNRSEQFLEFRDNLIVIVDEAHWGLNKKMIRGVRNFCLGTRKHKNQHLVPIIGLTATPKKPDHMNFKYAYTISYAELCDQKFLARPVIKRVSTNYDWNPTLKREKLTNPSLEILNNSSRNMIILETVESVFKNNSNSKGLLFACGKKHAEDLKRIFTSRGISCGVVHSDLTQEEIKKVLDNYRANKIKLLINVQLLTQGFDLPSITDIYITRPCESEILIAQMIGRGSRITENKTHFTVYDFEDSISNQTVNKIINDARSLFYDDVFGYSSYRGIANKHTSPKTEEANFITLDQEFDDFEGIQIVENQTFGVEIEITCMAEIDDITDECWEANANKIIKTLLLALDIDKDEAEEALENEEEYLDLVYLLPTKYHESEQNEDIKNRWHVERDSSVGWEVVSPILVGEEGVMQVIKVCNKLTEFLEEHEFLKINYRCGLHITLATWLDSEERKESFINHIKALEPGLFSLVSPSRLFEFDPEDGTYDLTNHNRYCIPISGKSNEEIEDDRYLSVNLSKMGIDDEDKPHLVEVRMHNGTTESRKIIPWISLWMHIINSAAYHDCDEIEIGDIFTDTEPDEEDIFHTIRKLDIIIPETLHDFLWNRRQELAARWKDVIPEKVEEWEDDGWYED